LEPRGRSINGIHPGFGLMTRISLGNTEIETLTASCTVHVFKKKKEKKKLSLRVEDKAHSLMATTSYEHNLKLTKLNHQIFVLFCFKHKK